MIDIERVDYATVPTRDIARAQVFFADVLGLSRAADAPDQFEKRGFDVGETLQ